jgi:hypothetical protein
LLTTLDYQANQDDSGRGCTLVRSGVFLRRIFESKRIIIVAMSSALAIILKPIMWGWAVCLTDGRELARFQGLGARARALRYVRSWPLSGAAAAG